MVKQGTIKKCWGQDKWFSRSSQSEKPEKWPFFIHMIFSSVFSSLPTTYILMEMSWKIDASQKQLGLSHNYLCSMSHLLRKILFLINYNRTHICFFNRKAFLVILSVSTYCLRKRFSGCRVYTEWSQNTKLGTLESLTPWDNYS